jgi:hypothetical protein
VIFVSENVVLSQLPDEADCGVIGFHNLLTASNVEADSELSTFVAANLANPITSLLWQSDSLAEQYVTVTLNTEIEIDYVGIARHNLGSGRTIVELEGRTAVDGAWERIVDAAPSDDRAIIFRFTPQSYYQVRLKLTPTLTTKPIISVVYVGRLLVLQRRVYAGHTPAIFGRKDNILNGVSMNGQFLGRVLLSESLETNVDLVNLTPVWYREQFEPFVKACRELPFFYAWRPSSYPQETAYGWFTSTPRPSNAQPNNFMSVSFDLEAIA